MPAPFDRSRENSQGDIVEWARRIMSRPLRVLEDRGEEIAQAGVDSVRSTIQDYGRIDPDHNNEKDGPEQMIEGVRGEVTGSVYEERVNIKVGWDLTQYRDGYPELQDKGFQNVVGMESLSLARMVMAAKMQRILNERQGGGA